MNQQDHKNERKQDSEKEMEPAIPRVATNPNPRANENIQDKERQAANTNSSSSSAINSEITDGEDA
jgi:hypothetical protein